MRCTFIGVCHLLLAAFNHNFKTRFSSYLKYLSWAPVEHFGFVSGFVFLGHLVVRRLLSVGHRLPDFPASSADFRNADRVHRKLPLVLVPKREFDFSRSVTMLGFRMPLTSYEGNVNYHRGKRKTVLGRFKTLKIEGRLKTHCKTPRQVLIES